MINLKIPVNCGGDVIIPKEFWQYKDQYLNDSRRIRMIDNAFFDNEDTTDHVYLRACGFNLIREVTE